MRVNHLNSKQYFGMLILILLSYNISIFMNMSLARIVLGLACFNIIPGLLFLHILNIKKIDSMSKFLLSVGLSISFLIFGGLIINSLHPTIPEPLSTAKIVTFFDIFLLTLMSISYTTSKDDYESKDDYKLEVYSEFKNDNEKLLSPLIFSLLFPFISIFGTELMNEQENNIVLMFMLILIPIYIIILFYLDSRIPKITYPIAIIMIGISLHLMHSLTSNYLIGRDIHTEYYVSRLTVNSMLWDISNYRHAYNACLSIAILPPIYHLLLGIDVLYVFKVLFPIIGALIPAICYMIFCKYIEKKYAMLASFFFISQVPFIYDLQSATRTEIALIFFALAILVFFDNGIDSITKRILFLILMYSTVVSHYSTAYLFFIIVVIMSICEKLFSKFYGTTKKSTNVISLNTVLLLSVVIFFWYSQVTSTPFDSLIDFVKNTLVGLGDLFVDEMRSQSATAVVGVGVSGISRWIVMIVQDLVILFITIGLFNTIAKYKETKYDILYILIMVISWATMASMFVVPFMSTGYGVYRIYQMGLITLAPMLYRGTDVIFKHTNVKYFSSLFFLLILVLQFFCSTYFIDQVFGNPNCVELNREGLKHEDYYIYDSDVFGSKWINDYGNMNSKIYTDARGSTRILTSFQKKPPMNSSFFNQSIHLDQSTPVKTGYIYLWHSNMVNKRIFPTNNYSDVKPISEYYPLFNYKNSIYNNGGSEVYK